MRVLVVLGTQCRRGRHHVARARRVADRARATTSSSPARPRSTPTSACTRSPPPWCRSSCPTARTRRATPGPCATSAGWSAVPTSCTPTGCGPAAVAVLAVGRGPVPVVATLHNAAPCGALTGAVYAALERVVALRSALVLGVSADLVERMRRLGARRTGLAVRGRAAARGPRPATGTPCAPTSASAAAPRSPSSWRGSPRRRGSTCCSTPTASWPSASLSTWSPSWPATGRCGRPLQARIDAERLPVRLLGHRDDVPDLLAAADVVVSSAVWEGQPVGIQEALHAGAAVVATDVGGTGGRRRRRRPAGAAGRPGLAGAGDPRRRGARRRCATTSGRGPSSAPASCRPRPTRWRRRWRRTARCSRRRPRPEHRSEGWEPASRQPCRVGASARMTYR